MSDAPVKQRLLKFKVWVRDFDGPIIVRAIDAANVRRLYPKIAKIKLVRE